MLDKWSELGRATDTQQRLNTLGRRMAPGGLDGATESSSPVVATDRGAPVPALPVQTYWLAVKEGDEYPGTITVGDTAPAAPLLNDVWIDTT